MPALWLGNRVLRFSEADDLAEPLAKNLGPAWPSAHGPSNAICDPEQRLVSSPPVEHEARLILPLPMNRALVIDVILAALNDETVDGPQLPGSDDA